MMHITNIHIPSYTYIRMYVHTHICMHKYIMYAHYVDR